MLRNSVAICFTASVKPHFVDCIVESVPALLPRAELHPEKKGNLWLTAPIAQTVISCGSST